eukprot:3288465-Heterocapsa_arctica.AAC.1
MRKRCSSPVLRESTLRSRRVLEEARVRYAPRCREARLDLCGQLLRTTMTTWAQQALTNSSATGYKT